MAEKLDIKLFIEHYADEFPLNQIIDFMKDKNIGFGTWSSSMECDYCESKVLEYFREEEVYYNSKRGFNLKEIDAEDDCVDFAIYKCPQCGKWSTYIE